jgi:hypothetical protein
LLGALAASPFLGVTDARAQRLRLREGGGRLALRDGRLWMQVRIGSHGPYPFIIDTGTFVTLIRAELARELGLRTLGSLNMRGIGGAVTVARYLARDVRLGQVEVGDVVFAAQTSALRVHSEAMGALSASVLTFADAELDFEALEWRIHPDGLTERPGYEMLPSLIQRARMGQGASPIFVDATIGGQVYRLQADTGSPAQLHLWPRAVRRSGLWDNGRPFAPVRPGGIGGEGARGRLMRIGEVRLGSLAFPRALVVADNPRTADTHEGDGLIGLPLLQRMNLSTDLRRNRLWARANAAPPPPERYGLSGMWVDEAGGRVTIVEVSPASPAAEAGLRIGDTIPGVTLGAFVNGLSGRPGDSVEIAYRRAGETRRTRLTLRAFL